MKTESQNDDKANQGKDNLSEQEKMDALVAELAGDSNDTSDNDLQNNDDDSKIESDDNLKNNDSENSENGEKNINNANQDDDNLSEQEKMNALVAEIAGDSDDTSDNYLQNNDINSKIESDDNLKIMILKVLKTEKKT